MNTIGDICPDAKSTKCSEKGCRVPLPKSSATYCGEAVRDYIMGKTALKMFDCIIVDSQERISAVELKYRKGQAGVKKGWRIDDIRAKFTDGLIVLRNILYRMAKSHICVQLVLYTKTKIKDRSELKKLRQPLDNVSQKPNITNAIYGDKLPGVYVAAHDLSTGLGKL